MAALQGGRRRTTITSSDDGTALAAAAESDATAAVPPPTEAAPDLAWSTKDETEEMQRHSWGLTWGRAAVPTVAPTQLYKGTGRPVTAMHAISVLRALAVTGLLIVFGDAGAAAADVVAGPGPTNYTVQPQPAPGTCHYHAATNGQTLPDPNCTPGAISPKVTQDTLDTTICRTGYTKSIRPPASITETEKRENAAAYGYSGSLREVEYDHLVPLELGGDPNDPRNLWIEPGASPNLKDGVESRLHQLVCEGRAPLTAAQEAIATDWTTALDTLR